MGGLADIAAGKKFASPDAIPCRDPDPYTNFLISHGTAQITLCFVLADADRHDTLERIGKRLPIRSICHLTTASTARMTG
jgi:hypothetical protein